MKTMQAPVLEQDCAWFVGVPKQQEFTQPTFHFGERVKWVNPEGSKPYTHESGRVIGMLFDEDEIWHYTIRRDEFDENQPALIRQPSLVLKLIKDSSSIRGQLEPQSAWLMTESAAAALGISAAQLRNLRRKGLFKIGYHFRDTSVPGSGKPRWQWNVERCAQALAVPPEKRTIRL